VSNLVEAQHCGPEQLSDQSLVTLADQQRDRARSQDPLSETEQVLDLVLLETEARAVRMNNVTHDRTHQICREERDDQRPDAPQYQRRDDGDRHIGHPCAELEDELLIELEFLAEIDDADILKSDEKNRE